MIFRIKKIKSANREIIFSLLLIAVIVALIFSSSTAQAEWIEPSSPPPLEQLSTPLTTGGEDQAKQGYLLLDPNYNPTQTTSLIFDPQRPLDVRGAGAKIFTPYLYSDVLTVNTDTLYVDSVGDWVGIGTSTQLSGDKFEIVGGTVQVGTTSVPISGRTVSGYSSDNVGVYGSAGTAGQVGVYGYSNVSGGYGVRGTSVNNVGVRGESLDGYGIYASNQSQSLGAVFGSNSNGGLAGYFDGRLNSVADMVSDTFFPMSLSPSILPFTSGHTLLDFEISDVVSQPLRLAMAYDGTYIWSSTKLGEISSGKNLIKVRASDGEVVGKFNINGLVAPTIYDLKFDGQYLWATSTGTGDYSLVKFDPVAGQQITTCDTRDLTGVGWGGNPQNLTVSTINGEVFIWTANQTGHDVTKFDRNCNQIGVYPVGNGGTGNDLNRLYNGEIILPTDILFAEDYIWVAANVANLDDQIIKINITTGAVEDRYFINSTLSVPRFAYDGQHFWVVSYSTSLTRPTKAFKISVADGTELAAVDLASRPLDVEFDGQNIWVSSDNGSGRFKQYVTGGTLSKINPATNLAKDYLAVLSTGYWNSKILIADDYLWSLSACDYNLGANDPDCGFDAGLGAVPYLRLMKMYIGKGYGDTNLSSVVKLNTRVGSCSVTTAQECTYDWHCPGVETCSINLTSQSGDINITGLANLKKNHCFVTATNKHLYSSICSVDADCSAGEQCVGGDVNVGTDLEAINNLWGGTGDENVSVVGDIANCSDGKFIKGVTLDAGSLITTIHCREL